MGAWIALTLLVIAGLALLLRADAGSIANELDESTTRIADSAYRSAPKHSHVRM